MSENKVTEQEEEAMNQQPDPMNSIMSIVNKMENAERRSALNHGVRDNGIPVDMVKELPCPACGSNSVYMTQLKKEKGFLFWRKPVGELYIRQCSNCGHVSQHTQDINTLLKITKIK